MKRKSILIFDEELLIRDLLYDFFSERDWGVSIHDSGEKALNILKNKNYDIALIDLKSTEADSISLVKKIKNIYPSMPITVMTAFPSVETAVEALRLKVDDYIIKPFNINKLFKNLENIVEKSQSRLEEINTEQIHPTP
jgi:DNA-binding NtrC family response regulator